VADIRWDLCRKKDLSTMKTAWLDSKVYMKLEGSDNEVEELYHCEYGGWYGGGEKGGEEYS